MKTFLRIMMFGFFAAVGAALAICVAGSATPRATEPADAVALAPAVKERCAGIVCPDASSVSSETKPPSDLPPADALEMPSSRVGDLLLEPLPVSLNPPLTHDASSLTTAPMPGALEVLRRQPVPSPTVPGDLGPAKPNTIIDCESNGKLRIRIYDEDIRTVLDRLSEQGKLNILASKSLEGKVSATLIGVDAESALQAILKSAGYVSRRDGNFWFVGTAEDIDNAEQALDRVGTQANRNDHVAAAERKSRCLPPDPRHGALATVTNEYDSDGTLVTVRKYADGYVVIETPHVGKDKDTARGTE